MTICITDIHIRNFALPLEPPFRASWDHQVRTRFSATLVEVHTDAGIMGYGSGDSMYGFDQFKHLFIGQDVSQTERHSDVLATLAFHYARYWPLEIATWDVLGKAANLPLFRLWGGHSNRVPAYCSTGICPFLEYPFDPPGWTPERRDFILADPVLVSKDGDLVLSEQPGLGVTLREDLEQFEVQYP